MNQTMITITHPRLKLALLLSAAAIIFPSRMFGQGTATFSVVYAFNGSTDGASPTLGKLVQDSAGNLYGTAQLGGDPSCDSGEFLPGCGIVYKIDPAGNETALYSFTQYTENISGLSRDSKGNLYGTTESGGAFVSGGSVFKIDPAGNETTIQSFQQVFSPTGWSPSAGVIPDANENTYGIADNGGQEGEGCFVTGCGVLFALSATGSETVLHTFDGSDGASPGAPLLGDKQRNLYGIMQSGGNLTDSCFACGTVFKLDASGTFTVLHRFAGGADGANPLGSGLIEDRAGNLYGVTAYGGLQGNGVVFKVDASGNESVLYTFKGVADGGHPYGTLLQDTSGNLYGTTTDGGANGFGVVFRIDPSGRETVLHTFAGGTAGKYPEAGLVGRKTGAQTYELYGTTFEGGNLSCSFGDGCGLVFRLTLSGSADFLPE